MRSSGHLGFLLSAILLFPVTGNTGTITTTSIVAKTTAAALSCMRWMPIGMCFWLRCSWSGCRVRTSIKIGHYNPDLVVSSYNELGGNPWVEIRATLGLAQKTAATGLLGALLPVPIESAGNRTEGSANKRDHKNLVFREADAIGHPLNSPVRHRCRGGAVVPVPDRVFLSLFHVWARCLVLAPGGPRDLLPGESAAGTTRDRYLAPADLGWRLSPHRLDHTGRGAQSRNHQCPTRW